MATVLMNYHNRQYMAMQDRLSDLGILSIERDRFSEIDKRILLEMFAQRKARRVKIL